MSLPIRSAMTISPHTIGPDQTLRVAKFMMAEHGIRHLPVLEGGHCVGLLSDRDIKVAYAVEPERAADTKVIDACASEVFTVSPETTLAEAAGVMARDLIGSVVIMENGKVVGIFTTTDACKVIAERLR